jgi:WD40 repeat protein
MCVCVCVFVCACQIWDLRSKRFAQSLEGRFPVTAVSYGADGNTVFSGGIENTIACWDVRKVRVYVFPVPLFCTAVLPLHQAVRLSALRNMRTNA